MVHSFHFFPSFFQLHSQLSDHFSFKDAANDLSGEGHVGASSGETNQSEDDSAGDAAYCGDPETNRCGPVENQFEWRPESKSPGLAAVPLRDQEGCSQPDTCGANTKCHPTRCSTICCNNTSCTTSSSTCTTSDGISTSCIINTSY